MLTNFRSYDNFFHNAFYETHIMVAVELSLNLVKIFCSACIFNATIGRSKSLSRLYYMELGFVMSTKIGEFFK
jgi:hypothetical protein